MTDRNESFAKEYNSVWVLDSQIARLQTLLRQKNSQIVGLLNREKEWGQQRMSYRLLVCLLVLTNLVTILHRSVG